MKIYLNEEMMKHKDKIVKMLEEMELHDPIFSNTPWKIIGDHSTWLEGDDELLGAKVLRAIFRITEEDEHVLRG